MLKVPVSTGLQACMDIACYNCQAVLTLSQSANSTASQCRCRSTMNMPLSACRSAPTLGMLSFSNSLAGCSADGCLVSPHLGERGARQARQLVQWPGQAERDTTCQCACIG